MVGNEKYLVLHRDNKTATVQMQLYQKQRAFSQFFATFFKRGLALSKSASQHLYHIQRSLPRKLSWKKSLLLTCKILGLIFNTLAADDRYHIPDKDNLTIPTQMQLSERQQTSSQFLAAFLISSWNLKPFEKKMTTLDYLFPNLGAPKMWLDKSLQRPVSQNPWTSNMVNMSKHC